MTKQSLTEATRRFKFFPSIAELAEFLSSYRGEKLSYSNSGREDGQWMRENNLARLQLREWPEPKLPYRGVLAWREWAFRIAMDQVRVGLIDGTYAVGRGYTLTKGTSAPIVHEELWEKWSAMPKSDWENHS